MDLVSMLEKEIDSKLKDASIIDKIYYIVKRMCEELQYDYRWLWGFYDYQLTEKIFNKEINVFDVRDVRVVCTSFSRAYATVADILLSNDPNYDATLFQGKIGHAYSITYLKDGTYIEIDPVSYTNDFFNVKKGLKFDAVRIKDNEEKDYLEERALLKIGYTNSKLYLDYLKLLKKEILDIEEMSNEKLNEIFNFIKDYSNFNNLGLKEASDLILFSLKNILEVHPKNFGFRRLTLYNRIINDNILLYKVPKDNEGYEHYCMYLKNNKIKFSQITKSIENYAFEFEYDNEELKKYLKNKL